VHAPFVGGGVCVGQAPREIKQESPPGKIKRAVSNGSVNIPVEPAGFPAANLREYLSENIVWVTKIRSGLIIEIFVWSCSK